MKSFRSAEAAACAALLLLCTGVAASATASPIWSRAWTTLGPPRFVNRRFDDAGLRGVAFADDGDVLIAGLSYSGYDEQITRLADDGTLRWSGSVAAYADSGQIVPLADGGALATFRDPSSTYTYAARIDGTGHVLWQRDLPAIWLAPMSAGRVAAADCSYVSVLDDATGTVNWQHALQPLGYCVRGGIATDADANVYFVSSAHTNATASSARVAKFDAAGTRLWERLVVTHGEAGLLGVAGTRLYLRDDDETIALDPAGGSEDWRVSGAAGLLAGAVSEPIVVDGGTLTRLRAADGAERWSVAIGENADPISIVDGALVAQTDEGLLRVDTETGVVAWTSTLPAGNGWTSWARFGGFSGGTFTALGSDSGKPFIQRVDFATGAMLNAVAAPDILQGVEGDLARDGADVFGFSLSNEIDDDYVRVRSVDADSGEVRWDAATSLQNFDTNLSASLFDSRWAVGPDAVAMAVPMTNVFDPRFGLVRVVSYDRASGSTKWNVALHDEGQGSTSVSEPIIDVAGNVFVAVNTTVDCPDGTRCSRETIYKLAAADGTTAWRYDGARITTDPPAIVGAGADLIVIGPHNGSPTLRRLSGADGAEMWQSDVFAGDGVSYAYRNGDDRLLVFSARVDGASSHAELDLQTGAVLWSFDQPCFGNCWGYAASIALSGDLWMSGSENSAPGLVHLHDDGSGAADVWEVAAADPSLMSYTENVSLDDAGSVWLSVGRFGSWVAAGTWYGRFDAGAGMLASSQSFRGIPLSAPAAGTLLLATALDEPTASAVAKHDATISATGNLSAALSLDRTHVSPGDLIGFDLAVAYVGDQPIHGARLTGRMPWPSGATDIACTGSGVSNCAPDARRRDVRATFDLEPGGVVHVTGRIRVLDTDPWLDSRRTFGLTAAGPDGLSELETIDNFARAAVAQSLFYGGFEPD